ncbi:MAG: hypothetical protein QM727_10970 [Niabella sp.]
MKRIFFILLIGVVASLQVWGQEALPDFSVYKVGKRVVLSWTNDFKNIKQLSIQRSHDKVNYFKTIATMPDPTLAQNGFADVTAANDSMYYRIFIMFDQGKFVSSAVKQPVVDTLGLADAYASNAPKNETAVESILPTGYVQSKYVFLTPRKYVRVELPYDNKKYSIRFFDITGKLMFELKDMPERRFTLDRSYFHNAGFVNYELSTDGKVVEQYKVYVPKDF